ncbi:MAG TPA: TadE/TadG family type IV pilus assembly protein [Ilumatobacter sp.]|nr:TadE/TadG family type IV pilus assembly protein [Ilumatobacter sp.]
MSSHRDRGEVTVTVISIPVILLAMLLAVQVGLAYHSRRVVSGSVQDGATSAAMLGSTPEQGVAIAEGLIAGSAGNLLSSTTVTGDRTGDVVTVRATGTVVKVFPLFPTFTASASFSATVERFRPQGEP